MPTSRSNAVWEGKLKDGRGTFAAVSGAFKGPYTFKTRFEGALERAGTPSAKIETAAACTIEMVDGGPKITKMELTVKGVVPGVDQATFARIANETKAGCPVSRALAGIPSVTVTATLG